MSLADYGCMFCFRPARFIEHARPVDLGLDGTVVMSRGDFESCADCHQLIELGSERELARIHAMVSKGAGLAPGLPNSERRKAALRYVHRLLGARVS